MSLNVSAVTGQSAALAAAAADAFNDFWDGVPSGTDDVKRLYANDTVADDVLVDELASDNKHNVQQSVVVLNLAGTNVDEPLPPNVSVVLSKTSDVPTRRGRGRSYAPPPTTSSLNSGKMASASVDIYIAAWTNLMANLASTTFTGPPAASRGSSCIPPAGGECRGASRSLLILPAAAVGVPVCRRHMGPPQGLPPLEVGPVGPCLWITLCICRKPHDKITRYQ